MAEITVPKRNFKTLRRLLRTYAPSVYGKLLTSDTARRLFNSLRGRETLALEGDLTDRFTMLYEKKAWQVEESLSGGGSNLYATQNIREQIPSIVKKYHIQSILDVPCGDFFWFNEMHLSIDSYIGGDIVGALIEATSAKFSSPARSFRVIDITKDKLPPSDLLLCRDLFIHFSNSLVMTALRNIADADLKYFLATNHSDVVENIDIDPGMHRRINLCIPPFNFPPPLEQIDDCAVGTQFQQLALWRVADLRPLVARSRN